MNDLEKSHVELAVFDEILQKLTIKFGKKSPLTTTRGKVQDYHRMSIGYRQNGNVKFPCKKKVKNYWKKHRGTWMGQPKRTQPTTHST